MAVVTKYLCDLCGCEIDDEKDVHKVTAPYLCNMIATEYGTKLRDSLYYDSREFDLCYICTYKVIVIREVPKFHLPSEYEFYGRGLLEDADE